MHWSVLTYNMYCLYISENDIGSRGLSPVITHLIQTFRGQRSPAGKRLHTPIAYINKLDHAEPLLYFSYNLLGRVFIQGSAVYSSL